MLYEGMLEMLLHKLSSMHRQWFIMFSNTQNTFGTSKNSATSTSKKMSQDMLWPEVYFAEMCGRKFS